MRELDQPDQTKIGAIHARHKDQKKKGEHEVEMIRVARRGVQVGSNYIESCQKFIRSNKELVKVYLSLSKLSPDQESRVDDLNQEIENLEKIVPEEQERIESLAILADADQSLDSFNLGNMPEQFRREYISKLIAYKRSSNSHFIIELFVLFVKAGVNPAKWILEFLADGLEIFLSDPSRDAANIGKHLSVGGVASGSKIWQERSQRADRTPAMADMAILIRDFDMSHEKAASAVILKHEIDRSKSAIRKYFYKFFGTDKDFVTDAAFAVPMTEYERTRFVSSFPVKARKLMSAK